MHVQALALIAVLLVAPALHAQTPDPSTAAILAKIAALEQQIATLKAQLQPAPTVVSTGAARPTLAEASAEAAKVQHDWPRSTSTYSNADLKDGPPVAAPPPYVAPVPGQEQIRQGDYSRAALKDEMYWKARMQDVRAKLDADRTFLADAVVREAALNKRAHLPVDSNDYIRNRVLRAQVDGDWTAAVAEVGRLKALVANDARAITTAEEEARRANVPAGWLRP
jgi:hypothetical protein